MRKAAAKACIAIAIMLSFQPGPALSAQRISVDFDRSAFVTRPEPLTIGVGVHFGIGGAFNYVAGKSAALIKDMGFGSYRDDLAWPVFDQAGPGKGAPQPRRLFEFMKLAPARPLLILGHGNPQVAEGNPPLTDTGRQAFADFAARAAAVTAAFDPIYEVWNEWNIRPGNALPFLVGPGQPEDPRAAQHYAALARTTVPAIAKAAPRAPILVGAVGVDSGWQWTNAIVEDGAVMAPAGLSVHMYNHCDADVAKRNATEMIDRLDALQHSLSARNGKPVPISVTEFGWPTAKRPCVIDRQVQADNIAQFLLWSAAQPWMKGAWVYQLKDQGRDENDLEANFGLFDYDYNPKPAACAVREVIGLVAKARAYRLSRPMPDVFLLAVDMGDHVRLVAWTTRHEIAGRLVLPVGVAEEGRTLCAAAPGAGGTDFELGATPLVVTLKQTDTLDFSAEISIK